MLDPNYVVAIAEISQYLWNDAIPKEKVFFNGTIDPRKAQQLYIERKALQYGIAQSLSGLPGTSNYVYALCGAKLQLANEIYTGGTSGGGVIPGGGGNFGVYEYSGNATLNSTSITFAQGIGLRLLYASRGGIDTGTILTSGSPTGNQVLWDSATGTLTVASTVPFYSQEFVRILVQQ
jgi:hypothetical protein